MAMSDDERRKLAYLKAIRTSLSFFGKHCLQIRTKAGDFVQFIMNEPQKYIHKRIEDQLERTGKVRVLILKGRQQGVSTYTAARYYQKSSTRKGRNVYIMSHEQSASDNLFNIVERYHKLNPAAPHTGVSNVKELVFDKLDSSYQVGTAGQKAGGRGRTITLYHGSEVAFWNNASEHFAASIQAVPDADGTEIILESTANGPTGEFYERCQDALAGRGDYELIFVPWFWSSEYRRPDLVDENFELSDESVEGDLSEVEYAEVHGLDLAQMAWRRNKISELRSLRVFKQEYPATPDEAFQSSQTESFIPAPLVLRARKRTIEPAGPLILGVDPAGPGGDRFAVAARQGYCIPWIKWRDKLETAEAHQWLKSLIDEYNPARVFIDAGGIGYPTISLLRSDGPPYSDVIRPVNFGSKSEFKQAHPHLPGPARRRSEMWQRQKEWFELEEGVSIPDMDVLQADFTAPMVKPTATNDLQLESKPDMKKRGVRSPDLADACVLTFASLRGITDNSEKRRPADPMMSSEPPPADAPVIYGDFGDDAWMA